MTALIRKLFSKTVPKKDKKDNSRQKVQKEAGRVVKQYRGALEKLAEYDRS